MSVRHKVPIYPRGSSRYSFIGLLYLGGILKILHVPPSIDFAGLSMCLNYCIGIFELIGLNSNDGFSHVNIMKDHVPSLKMYSGITHD